MSKVAAGLSLVGQAPRRQRDVIEILNTDSVIGIAEIDRGFDEWDPSGGEKGEGAFVWRPDVSPELALDLVVNEGKGFGAQTVSENDFSDVLNALHEIQDAGFDRPDDPEGYVPPADVIRQSWRMVYPRKQTLKEGKLVWVEDREHPEGRCMVSFRTKNGRGAKPAVVHKNDFPRVLELLSNIPDLFEKMRDDAYTSYQKVKAAEAAKKAAEAAANSSGETTTSGS